MDPQQQQQMAGMMAGFGAAVLVLWLLILAFLIFCSGASSRKLECPAR